MTVEILVLAGPRLTTNCLTDHHTWYNLQVCFSISKMLIYKILRFLKGICETRLWCGLGVSPQLRNDKPLIISFKPSIQHCEWCYILLRLDER